MKTREIKEIRSHTCPVKIVFGNSRNWGMFYNDKNRNQAIAIFVKNITPNLFDEILEHEALHLAINSAHPRIPMDREHKIIEKILYIRGDWLFP